MDFDVEKHKLGKKSPTKPRTLLDVPGHKLGKLPAKEDPRQVTLGSLAVTLPNPPLYHNWTKWTGVVSRSYRMFTNDRLQTCTLAAVGNQTAIWSANVSKSPVWLSDDDIVSAYTALSGYNPEYGWNDNGVYVWDLLNHWRGVGIGGHKIKDYISLNWRNHRLLQQAIWIFGGAYVGLQLPWSATGQSGYNLKWDVPAEGLDGDGTPGSWGGHAVNIVSYDQTGMLVISWGQLQFMTYAFLDAYADECWVTLSEQDWLCPVCRRTPWGGVNLRNLLDDLQAVRS